MTETPSLIVFSREYPPVTVGGTSTVARNLSAGLARAGWEVAVISANPYDDRDVRERIEAVTVHRIGTGVVYNKFSGLGDDSVRTHRRMYQAANRLIDESGRPTAIALPDLFCYPEAALVAREHRVPIVNILLQDFHTLTLQDVRQHHVTNGVHAKRDHLLALEDKALRGSDHVVFISQALSDAITSHYPDLKTPHSVVHLGVDTAEIASITDAQAERDRLRATLPPAARDLPLLVACGRLVTVKGFAPLIRALALLVEAGAPAHLAVIGIGPEELPLRGLAAALNVQQHVSFLGDISRPTALTWMSLATVAVVPSLWESFCYVCAEMMALGAPVVASAIDSLNELVPSDRFGYRVPLTDRDGRREISPIQLAAALGAALGDPEEARRRADAGREHILGTFTNARFSEGVGAICTRLARTGIRADG